jgi:hypothetical protein
MPSPSPATTLRRRGGSPSGDTSSTDELTPRQQHQQQQKEQLKTSRTAADLIADHPAIKPVAIPASQGTPLSSSSSSTQAGHSTGEFSGTTARTTTATTPFSSIASRIIHILLKPFYFLLFALLHLSHELIVSTRTMKTLVQVFFLPHLFPVAPELVRIVRKDVGTELAKKPTHLAVITQKSGITLTGEVDETEENEWHARVAQLAQWSSAVGIKTLSIMRNARKCLFCFVFLLNHLNFFRRLLGVILFKTACGFGLGRSDSDGVVMLVTLLCVPAGFNYSDVEVNGWRIKE